jgi:7,8-dihydroneopterin aldolase/epimerase/oxygenase
VDRIVIKDLDVAAHIGVTEPERAQPQRLLITVELERDLAEAGRTDAVDSTTPYDVVADMICQTVTERPRKLVEAMAEEIAEMILSHNMARAVTVEVKKFSIPRSQYVAVQIHRSQ